MAIHPTALIDRHAELDGSVEVGAFTVIGPKVKIGPDTVVGAHCVIEGDTTIGRGNRLFQFSALGAIPQDLKFAGEPTKLLLGDHNQIREFATLHVGTAGGGGMTRVGSRNLLMASSHVAHDCQVGDHVILANSAALAGHVTVGDHAIFGGLSAVHQFARIGRHAFVSGGAMVTMDVPPFCTVQGDRAQLAGLNTVGLSRNGFSEEAISRIKAAYKILFRSKLGIREAVAKVKAEFMGHAEIDELIGFIEGSARGVAR
ncbi:MAG: acyl-ACP--UDP-N-acetylglucosamine O-acyltransferase [Deltaproteobacteria bacterium]